MPYSPTTERILKAQAKALEALDIVRGLEKELEDAFTDAAHSCGIVLSMLGERIDANPYYRPTVPVTRSRQHRGHLIEVLALREGNAKVRISTLETGRVIGSFGTRSMDSGLHEGQVFVDKALGPLKENQPLTQFYRGYTFTVTEKDWDLFEVSLWKDDGSANKVGFFQSSQVGATLDAQAFIDGLTQGEESKDDQ